MPRTVTLSISTVSCFQILLLTREVTVVTGLDGLTFFDSALFVEYGGDRGRHPCWTKWSGQVRLNARARRRLGCKHLCTCKNSPVRHREPFVLHIFSQYCTNADSAAHTQEQRNIFSTNCKAIFGLGETIHVVIERIVAG